MDITKCSGIDCPVKLKCRRYTAKKGFLQSYFVEVPGKIETINGKKTFKCDMFWADSFDLEEIIFGE